MMYGWVGEGKHEVDHTRWHENNEMGKDSRVRLCGPENKYQYRANQIELEEGTYLWCDALIAATFAFFSATRFCRRVSYSAFCSF